MKKLSRKRYSGVSLVEMLITMIILSFVMLLVSVTLTTMVRTSIISTSRTSARQESEFILELVRKTIRNSSPDDIRIYNVTGRSFDADAFVTIDQSLTGYDVSVPDGGVGTEIHFRPIGYDKWVCIGFFPLLNNPEKGVILKAVRRDLTAGSECFNGESLEYAGNTLALSSEDIYINDFSLHYFDTYDENYIITIDLDVEPVNWLPTKSDMKPNYFQQSVVSTQKLTWED